MKTDWPMIITAISGALSGVAAVLSAIAAIYAARAKLAAAEAKDGVDIVKIDVAEVKHNVETVQKDIKTVEVATNSMKDSLVEATDKAAFARGSEAERAKTDKGASDHAAGVLEGTAQAEAKAEKRHEQGRQGTGQKI